MFQFTNIQEYHGQLNLQKDGCVQAVQYFLQRMEHSNQLNAFIEIFGDESLERAKNLDDKRVSGKPTGKLHGVIIAIKDVICYKQHHVGAGSKILKGFTSVYNATAVEKLLAEDAIIIGNCNCDEFAMGSTNEHSSHGPVLNALDETKVPGGSSGGSAVAVQAGLCMVSLGSDTGGSVRQPADFCGIVGLKPGYGSISRYGLIAYASSFDQIGIFGKNIEDVALVLEVIAGKDEYDSTASQHLPTKFNICAEEKKYRIAYFKNGLDHPSLDTEISSATLNLLEKLKGDGHDVKGIDFELLEYIVPAYYVLTTAEASSNLSRYDGIRFGHSTSTDADLTKFYTQTRTNGFGKEVKRRIMLGTFVLSTGYYDAYYTKAQQVRQMLMSKTTEIFKDFDAVIIPTVTNPAFDLGEMKKDPIAMYLADIYTVYANLVGIPGISIPLFKHSNGMPFGVQIMTNKDNELSLLQISDYLLKKYRQYHN